MYRQAGAQKAGKDEETIREEEEKERRGRPKYLYKSLEKGSFPINEDADETVSAEGLAVLMYLLQEENKERTQSNGEVPKIQLGKVTVAAHLTGYLFQEGLPLQVWRNFLSGVHLA